MLTTEDLSMMSVRHIWGAEDCVWRETIVASERYAANKLLLWQVRLQRFSGNDVVEECATEFTEKAVKREVEGDFSGFPTWYRVPRLVKRLALHRQHGTLAEGEIPLCHSSQHVLWLKNFNAVLLVHHLPDEGGRVRYNLPQLRVGSMESDEPTPLLKRAARDITDPKVFTTLRAVYDPEAGHMLRVKEARVGFFGWMHKNHALAAQMFRQPPGSGLIWVETDRLEELAERGFLSPATALVVNHLGNNVGL